MTVFAKVKSRLKAFNLRSAFELLKRGVTLPIETIKMLRRWQHRQNRLQSYRMHNAGMRGCGKRQQARYGRNRMDEQQRNSHKPPAIWPNHLGPSPWVEQKESPL